MIAYVPIIYPDELLYSFLCRFHVHCGFTRDIHTFEILLEKKTLHSSDMPVKFNQETLEILNKHTSTDMLIMNHTLFPYYVRFLNAKQKKKAFKQAKENQFDLKSCFLSAERLFSKNLLYCPECTQKDRDTYGETYWHRTSQIPDIKACPEHGCKLIMTECKAFHNIRLPLTPAESVIKNSAPIENANPPELSYAQFLKDGLTYRTDFTNRVSITSFLKRKLGRNYQLSSSNPSTYQKLASDINFALQDECISGTSPLWLKQLLSFGKYDVTSIYQLIYFLNLSIPGTCNRVKATAKKRADAL